MPTHNKAIEYTIHVAHTPAISYGWGEADQEQGQLCGCAWHTCGSYSTVVCTLKPISSSQCLKNGRIFALVSE